MRDAWVERGRFAGMILALAVSLAAVGGVLGAYAVLTREIARNYLDTHPADATIELGADVDPTLLARVRALPGVEVAEAGEVMRARFAVGDEWKPILLFVAADLDHHLAIQHPVDGDRRAGLAVERTAAELFDLSIGEPNDGLVVRFADGAEAELPITAIVHDPGLAPAWQERVGYAYVSRQQLADALGRPVALHDLRLRFTDRADTAEVDRAARTVADALVKDGATVHQIRVPPLERHPHQRQMTTALTLLSTFAGLSLVLSALLVATSLAALLARQVREIGVMKTVGASGAQLALMYVVLVGALGAAAVAVAVPLGVVSASGLSGLVAGLLNFELADRWSPPWVWGVQGVAGVLVPLALAAVPIGRASTTTVRQALDQHGVSPQTLGPAFARWPRAVRAKLRRPARLALTLGLLASAGAMFVAARSVSDSWRLNLAKIAETRFDTAEVRFARPVPLDVVEPLAAVAGVARLELWDFSSAAFAEGGSVEVARTWPDRGHGSLALIAVPPDTQLARFPLRSGRWLVAGDHDAAVVNQGVQAQRPGLAVGDDLALSIEGVERHLHVVGVVEEIASPGAVYVARGSEPTTSMVRLAAAPGASPGEVVSAVEAALDQAPLDVVIPRAELELAVGGHIELLVQSLTAMALVMAIVGGLGLAATTAIDVVERTREIGVLKSLGATPGQVSRMFLSESLVTAVGSTTLAFLGAVPLTWTIDGVVGRMGFLAPLPFAFSWSAAGAWVALVAFLSVAATWAPAGRAGALTVREALATT